MTQTPQTAIVTGGSRNIGQLTALELAKSGADVIVTYKTGKDGAEATVAQITALGRKARALQLDLSDTSGIPAFVASVQETLTDWDRTGIDILVNNAGTIRIAGFDSATEADLDAVYQTNYKSVFFLTQAFDSLMNDGGRIVNLSSRLAEKAFVPLIAYGPLKAAIQSLTINLAAHFAPRRIRVNAVAPGGLDDDFNAELFDNIIPGARDYISGQTTLGRIGVPEDVAGVIAFLASPASGFMTGQTVNIDGGFKL